MVARILPQTFLFPKDEWTPTTARSWLRANGYHYDDMDPKGNHYRFRQFDPKSCLSYGTKEWHSRRTASGAGRRKPKKILAVFCRRGR